MNRKAKIEALKQAFKGNLSNIFKIKENEEQMKVCCLVVIHEGLYQIISLNPQLEIHEKYLSRDLTEKEYEEFRSTLPLFPNSLTFELPDNGRGIDTKY